ncbi:CMRF35-like molecule 6 [Bos javanicus]|uniref:CMRF35-like molecule 6 n=1 Tax=Bos javanicus TaxID=9906 RepID=UPI002AA7E83E|nr:CMRF35-like molecule 6 [Bos javanicus]
MGGSLNMECRYQEEFIDDNKFWCTSRLTLESLREEDAGTYWYGIDVLSTFDPIFEVEVSVIPATGPERSMGSPGSPRTLPVPTWSTASAQETPDPGQPPRPLLGSAHFLLLVFLKVPLLLGMLGAVLWVHRPLRSSADRRRQSIYENQ